VDYALFTQFFTTSQIKLPVFCRQIPAFPWHYNKNPIHSLNQSLTATLADILKIFQTIIISVWETFSTIKEQAEKLNFPEKRKIVEKMVKQVIFGKKDITIEFAAPLKRNALCTTNCQLLIVNERR